MFPVAQLAFICMVADVSYGFFDVQFHLLATNPVYCAHLVKDSLLYSAILFSLLFSFTLVHPVALLFLLSLRDFPGFTPKIRMLGLGVLSILRND